MDLRQPPTSDSGPRRGGALRWLQILNLLLLLGLVSAFLLRGSPQDDGAAQAERDREVASKLKAAGALEEASSLYEQFLASGHAPPATQAKIAYSLGTTYLDRGQYERALRWFYEAEVLGAGDLAGEVGQKIVHSLERLGRHHAARAALSARTRLTPDLVQHSENDPVVALLGETEVRRSDVERTLDDLPPDVAQSFAEPARRGELLKKYVADELLWRKATRLEYDNDPQVRRRHAAMLKQLAVSLFVEREVFGKIQVDEADLRNYFEANQIRYQPKRDGEEAEAPALTFEQVRPAVERDYRISKMQAAYSAMVEAELATDDVQLFPERMTEGGSENEG